MTAKRLSQPPRTPPACLSMSSLRGMLSSSSTVQGVLTCPDMQNSLVPAARKYWDQTWVSSVVEKLHYRKPLCSFKNATDCASPKMQASGSSTQTLTQATKARMPTKQTSVTVPRSLDLDMVLRCLQIGFVEAVELPLYCHVAESATFTSLHTSKNRCDIARRTRTTVPKKLEREDKGERVPFSANCLWCAPFFSQE